VAITARAWPRPPGCFGLKAVIVVPHGNSREKNQAMIAQGADLVERGHDFQESLEFAGRLAAELGFAMVDSFHERLVMGTATYALELFEAAPPLDVCLCSHRPGSSVSGISAARNALGLKTEIVGVVSSESPSYALSFAQHKNCRGALETAIADGLACRKPQSSSDGGHLDQRRPHSSSARLRHRRGHARLLPRTRTTWPKAPAPPLLPPHCRRRISWRTSESGSC